MALDATYWNERYINNTMGWNIGYASTPLVHFINTSVKKSDRILIPGAGNAYEAEFLFRKGYENVTVVDFSQKALENIKKRCPEFPDNQLILTDFFEHSGEYDVILEQTFFCAITPNLRDSYNSKMLELLTKNGRLAGLLFNFPKTDQGPPFGGNIEEYKITFKGWKSVEINECYNSIPPRNRKEFFIIATK